MAHVFSAEKVFLVEPIKHAFDYFMNDEPWSILLEMKIYV